MHHFRTSDSAVPRDYTTTFRLIDGRTGKPKPMFTENALGLWLLGLFRCWTPDFIERLPDGGTRVKEGVLAHLAGYGLRCPVTGTWGDQRVTHNLITNVGHAAANGRISNQGAYSPFVNLCIGIGAVAAAATDQALGQELTTNGGARAAATATQTTTTVTNDTTQLVHTWTFSTTTYALVEEGIVDSATAPSVTTTTQSRVLGDTSVTVTAGASFTNGDFVQWESEIIQITAGGGTNTFSTILRGQRGTAAAGHASGTGLTDISTSGNMLAKQSFSAVNVNGVNGDQFTATHTVKT
jgi:hypothetical protein